MVVKWLEIDISNEFKSKNPNETIHKFLYADIVQTQLLVLDNCVKNIMASEDNSKIEYLKGYLYNSPSHEGIICWRALAEEHNLENVKHFLNSIDYESNSKSKNQSPKYPNPEITKNFNYTTDYSKLNSNDKSFSDSSDSGIYEGCYNGHHEKTTQEIRKVLNKIHVDLLKTNADKDTKPKDIKPINAHEAKLLEEYEKITSKLSPARDKPARKPSLDSTLSDEEISELSDKHPVKIEYPESSDYETSLKKLEKQSINKAEDELVSDCEIVCNDKKPLITSSSLSSNNIRPVKTKPEVKKVVPPRRKRNRLHAYLDKEVSSSEDYDVSKNPNFARNKFRDSKQKSAFKKVDQGQNNEKKDTTVEKRNQNTQYGKEIPENKGLWSQQGPEEKGLWSQTNIQNKTKQDGKFVKKKDFKGKTDEEQAPEEKGLWSQTNVQTKTKQNSKFVKKKDSKEKTDEELISEFERFSPRKSIFYSTEKREKYNKIYEDLNDTSNNDTQNRSAENHVNFNSIKNYDNSGKKIEALDENSAEAGPKINYQRPNSPAKLNNHVMTLYPVLVENKPGQKQAMPNPNINKGGPPIGYIGSPNMAKPKLPGGPENKPKFEVNTSINNYIKQANKKFQYKNDQAPNPTPQPKFKFLHKFSNKFIKKVNSAKRK